MRIIIPGEHVIQRGVYIFECPVCRKRFRYDDPYGVMCTGPNEMLDQHVPTLMRLVRQDDPIATVIRP